MNFTIVYKLKILNLQESSSNNDADDKNESNYYIDINNKKESISNKKFEANNHSEDDEKMTVKNNSKNTKKHSFTKNNDFENNYLGSLLQPELKGSMSKNIHEENLSVNIEHSLHRDEDDYMDTRPPIKEEKNNILVSL